MFKKLFIGALCLFPALCSAAEVVNINADWKFNKANNVVSYVVSLNDASWASVNLPHTWNALDGQDGGNDYYRGACWYRKHITLPTAYQGKTVYIRFGAANMTTTLYVNGKKVGTHTGGYCAFAFDITSYLKLGAANLIAVKVDNSASIVSPPLGGAFTFFGGITRDVQLLVENPIHISPIEIIDNKYLTAPIQVASSGVLIKQSAVSEKAAHIDIITKLRNTTSAAVSAVLEINIKNKNGDLVKSSATNFTLPADKIDTAAVAMDMVNPHLWNGITDPYLYRVEVNLKVGGTVVDSSIQPLGLRYFKVDKAKGFFLNGRSYPLRGIALHEIVKDKGFAISDSDRKVNIDMTLETGANYIRLAHYPHGDFTYDYLDSLGIVCWTENPCVNKVGDASTVSTYQQNASSQMYEMLHQKYNHPSIIFWGLCNEIRNESATGDPTPVVRHLNDLVKSEDIYRFTTLATNTYSAEITIPDIFSINRYNGWYGGKFSDFSSEMDSKNKAYTKPIGVSEYGAGANAFHHEWPPVQRSSASAFHPEEYQDTLHECFLKAINQRAYFWETSAWVAFDVPVDSWNEGGHPGLCDKGIISFDRKTKKDAFFWYKANWNQHEGVVYITSRRFTERHTLTVPVKVYSNCPTVTIFVNGKEIGSKSVTDHLFLWPAETMKEGINTIVARGMWNGQTLSDTVRWNCTATPLGSFPPEPPVGTIQVNFGKASTAAIDGYLKDAGDSFADRGNGYSYGWSYNHSRYTYERNSS
jgi:beta-galactosidase